MISTKKYGKIKAGTLFFLWFFMSLIVLLMGGISTNILTILSILLLIFTILICKSLTDKWITFSSIFVSFSFIVHCGQPLLILLGYDDVFGYDQRYYCADDTFFQACLFIYLCHIFLLLGLIIAHSDRAKPRFKNLEFDYNKLFNTGLILLLITIIPRLYIDVTRFMLYFQGGYLATYQSFSGFAVELGNIADIAVLVILVSFKKKKQSAKIVLIIAVLYHLIFMMTGNRGDAVLRIIILLFTYSMLFINKIKIRGMLVLMIGAVVGFAGLNTIGDLRNNVFSFNELLNGVVVNLFEEPIFLKIFAEFGVTIRTVANAIEYFPEAHGFTYGTNYIKSFAFIFPNIGGLLTNINNEVIFIYHFPTHIAMGGSFIGEMFFSFGWLGMVLAVPVGYFIGKIENYRINALEEKNGLKIVFSLIFIAPVLWWVRDYFCDIIREISWSIILLTIFYRVNFSLTSNTKASLL